MNPSLPVAARATRMAPSMASVPEEKKVNSVIPGGVTPASASRASTFCGVAKSWTLSQLAGSAPDGLGDPGVGVADVGDHDAAGEVEVGVAVDVGQGDAAARLVGQRVQLHHGGDAARGVALHALVPRPRRRTGRLRDHARHLGHRRVGPGERGRAGHELRHVEIPQEVVSPTILASDPARSCNRTGAVAGEMVRGGPGRLPSS